jgi:integrase/recombinase XerD
MGKYPFMNAVRNYLSSMEGVLAESTIIEVDRRLRRMNKDFIALVKAGIVEDMNPWKIKVMDIIAYLKLLRARGVKDSGLCHNVDTLTALLRFVGNPAMDKAKTKYPQQFPKRGFKRIPPIASNHRAVIIAAAEKVPNSDWRKMEAYALVVAAICTGLRNKELRLAKVCDIDLKAGTLFTEHVKGEGSYGQPRTTGIHPDGISFLKRYMKVRNEMLARKQTPTVEALFPALSHVRRDGDGHLSSNGLTMLRKIVTEETGVVFDLRACRRTFGQTAVDKNVPIEAVSRMLGHSSTSITEKYYCRMTAESAIKEAQKIWGNMPKESQNCETPSEVAGQPGENLPPYKNSKYLTGYA